MRRFRLEHFEDNVARLERFLDANDPSGLCAVFDVGTKATKLLVGPRRAPAAGAWQSSAFFNDGQLFPLGADYDLHRGRLDVHGSGALEGVCFFVRHYRELLARRGVSPSHMHGVGTAVFRWMNNRREVVDHIQRHGGFPLHVLQPPDEAFLSCYSIRHTHNVGRNDGTELGGDDVILLFDQGGGSTEVSFFYPKDLRQGGRDSLNEFGTVYLQSYFFRAHDLHDPHGEPDPKANRRRISKQFERVRDDAEARVQEWPGFPELVGRPRVHAYGMGTALSKCLRGSSFSQHNRVLTVADMESILTRQCDALDNSKQQVRTLFSALEAEQAAGGKTIADQLVLLYGLPVYQQLLRKFGLDRLRFAGFGLRYGAYLAVCSGLRLDGLTARPSADAEAARARVERPRVFLSHSKADLLLARQISNDLKNAGIEVWFDEEQMRVGDSLPDGLQKGIVQSQFMAVLLSKNSLDSNFVRAEWQAKWMEEMQTSRNAILPIRLDDSEMPPFLAHKVYADFRSSYSGGITHLLQAIRNRT